MTNQSYQIIICDTETTGLLAEKHDIIEISMIRLTKNDKGSYEEDQKTWCLKPLDFSTIEEAALKINGHILEDITHQTEYGKQTYRDANEVIVEIEQWIAEDGCSSVDRIFVGQNPFFDVDMMTALWKKTGNYQTFPFSLERNNRIIDTKQLAIIVDVCNNKRRLGYSLGQLVKSFGVKKAKAHRADADTKMTADLFCKIIEAITPVIQEHFGSAYSSSEES